MKKTYNKKHFVFNDQIEVTCESQDTSYGFRHIGTLYGTSDSGQILKVTGKCTYYNRTWESYTYQSLIRSLVEKFKKTYKIDITHEWEKFDSKQTGREEEESNSFLKTVGLIAKIGAVVTDSQEEKNKWQERMLKAGISGLSFPEDWETLSEDEKESRLEKVIAELSGKEIK